MLVHDLTVSVIWFWHIESNICDKQVGKVSSDNVAAKNGKVGSNFTAAKDGQVGSNFAATKNGKVGSNFAAAKNGQVLALILLQAINAF